MSDFPVKSGQTFLMIGDSITDHGRTGEDGPYGWGYVRMFMDIVAKNHPELAIDWVNKGIGGNTVEDLAARWDADVLAIQPRWLSIMIGINDVHRRIDEDADEAIAAFWSGYTSILERVESFSPRLVLLDPFYIASEERGASPDELCILARLGRYLDVVEEMAQKTGAVHIRTQQMFEEQLTFRSADHFGPEPVHPYSTGHLMVAMELYDTLVNLGADG